MAPAPRIDWAAAFAYFASLGADRSYKKVSDRFQVSTVSVRKHARDERWLERAADIDEQARQEASKHIARDRAARLVDSYKVIDESRTAYLARLADGEVDLKASDIAALIKLEQLLDGEATERIDAGQARAFAQLVLGATLPLADELDQLLGTGDARRQALLNVFEQIAGQLPTAAPAGVVDLDAARAARTRRAG